MATNSNNVSQGKPAVAGAVSLAPVGATLPTDAVTALAEAYVNMGYVSEDGVTVSTEMSTVTIKAWGGDTVLTDSYGRSETVKIKFMEAMNLDVLKMVYGDSNVTGTLDTGVKVTSKSIVPDPYVMVIDTILKGGVLSRTVYPNVTITAIGDQTYKDNEVVGFDMTFAANVDASGNIHYTYTKKPTAVGGE